MRSESRARAAKLRHGGYQLGHTPTLSSVSAASALNRLCPELLAQFGSATAPGKRGTGCLRARRKLEFPRRGSRKQRGVRISEQHPHPPADRERSQSSLLIA